MKSALYFRFSVLTLGLLCAAADGSALTLGKARSVVVLGQPLNLTIPVGIAAGEDPSTQCFDADVFYGDVQLERGRVSVVPQISPQSASAAVRVTAQTVVNEPVVTVYFKAGCQHTVSRKYVLLADLVSEVEAVGAERVPLVRAPVVAIDPDARPRADETLAKPSVSSSRRGGSRTSAPRNPGGTVPLVASGMKSTSQLVASSRAARKARLKLTPLDLRMERDPVLKSSDILLDLPLEDLQKRAQAVATWRALNASPEEVMRQDAQLQALDGDIKQLAGLTVKNQGAMIDLGKRLEQAQEERYRNPLVYALAFGLLLCLTGMAYLLMRSRRDNSSPNPWWSPSAMPDGSPTPGPHDEEPSASRSKIEPDYSAKTPVGSMPRGGSVRDESGVDIDLEARESAFSRLVQDSKQEFGPSLAKVMQPPAPVLPGHRDFSYSVNATLRAINTQEMLDERQQADFFMTLGQHEDAIHLLEHSIQHNEDANPLVYLDLLKMLHTLSRKPAYEHYREAFNEVFSGRVPPFAHFAETGHGLDAYEDVCEHIVALWPTEDALHFIEQCLVRTQDGLTQEFDLEAFRDLLTLHGVLLRIFATTETGLAPFSTFKAQALSQGPAAGPEGMRKGTFSADQTMPVSVTDSGMSNVDLDLSDSGNMLEFEEVTLSPTLLPKSPQP